MTPASNRSSSALASERYPDAPFDHREESTAWRGGCWSARHGLPKRANPYEALDPRKAWFAGFEYESAAPQEKDSSDG